MAYSELPKLKKNSVSTTIASPGINDTDTTIPVTELSVFYDADSNLITKGIVIGYDNATETYAEEITITGASGTSGAGNLTGATRGVNADGTIGAAKAHIATTNIAVMFSTGIYEQIRDNQIAIEANTRQILTANTTYYVATTGSDVTGDGTSGNPWATIQHAYNYIVANIDTAGYTTTIQVADGAYTSGLSVETSWSGGGKINLTGNISNPGNVTITTDYPINVTASLPAHLTISGFDFPSSSRHVYHDGSGQIKLNSIRFGAAAGGALYVGSKSGSIYCDPSSFEIYDDMARFAFVVGGVIFIHHMVLTLTDTPNFAIAFCVAQRGGEVYARGLTIASGSATGKYYSVESNSVLTLGASTLPGDVAGTITTGGQVI